MNFRSICRTAPLQQLWCCCCLLLILLQILQHVQYASSANAKNTNNINSNNINSNSISSSSKNRLPVRLRAERSAKLDDDDQLDVSASMIDATYLKAKDLISERRKLENLQGHVTDMSKNSAVTRHQQVTTTLNRGNDLEKNQEIFEEMTKILARNLTYTGEPLESAATGLALSRIDLVSPETRQVVQSCKQEQQVYCDPYKKYRNSDGTCNNLQNPHWGSIFTCFTRLLAPAYADGLSAPRRSITGAPLPNARMLSAVMHRDLNYPATYTHMTMQYGQFFAHDIAFTPSSRTKDGKMIQCCPPGENDHPQCYPILVSDKDPFYGGYKEDCLNFVRTAMCPQCKLGPREQMNQITSFIDGSMIYGSMENETRALWTQTGPAGRMHVSLDINGGELLPQSTDPEKDQCSKPEQNLYCFKAGDKRVNQHPALTALHIVFLRQHNRIVNTLKEVNPHWDGETLYNEAKRMISAQLQMITYAEWLPLILGPDAMKFLNLYVLPDGYTKYDPYTHPGIINEFSGAAFRFGHSLVNSVFAEILHNGKPSGYRLRENFFTPFGLYNGQYDAVLKGLISQASQNRDPFISMDMKNHLYRPKDSPYGLDLPAFNIQRGRDHGISGYTNYLKFCFDEKIYEWHQLDQYMPMTQRLRFQKLYKSVHDIDLFTAGLAEFPLPGAAVGPTFVCIIGIQMYNLKFGDRFWFEHGGQVGSFSPEQLQEIRKTTLARVICENSDNIEYIQKNVFRGESKHNPIVPCKSLPDIDYSYWREQPRESGGSYDEPASDQYGGEPGNNNNYSPEPVYPPAGYEGGGGSGGYSNEEPHPETHYEPISDGGNAAAAGGGYNEGNNNIHGSDNYEDAEPEHNRHMPPPPPPPSPSRHYAPLAPPPPPPPPPPPSSAAMDYNNYDDQSHQPNDIYSAASSNSKKIETKLPANNNNEKSASASASVSASSAPSSSSSSSSSS